MECTSLVGNDEVTEGGREERGERPTAKLGYVTIFGVTKYHESTMENFFVVTYPSPTNCGTAVH